MLDVVVGKILAQTINFFTIVQLANGRYVKLKDKRLTCFSKSK